VRRIKSSIGGRLEDSGPPVSSVDQADRENSVLRELPATVADRETQTDNVEETDEFTPAKEDCSTSISGPDLDSAKRELEEIDFASIPGLRNAGTGQDVALPVANYRRISHVRCIPDSLLDLIAEVGVHSPYCSYVVIPLGRAIISARTTNRQIPFHRFRVRYNSLDTHIPMKTVFTVESKFIPPKHPVHIHRYPLRLRCMDRPLFLPIQRESIRRGPILRGQTPLLLRESIFAIILHPLRNLLTPGPLHYHKRSMIIYIVAEGSLLFRRRPRISK